MKPKVYLAGKGQELGYRDRVKELYSEYFELFDPMRDGSGPILAKHLPGVTLEQYLERPRELFKPEMGDDIVKNDKAHISNSDYAVFYIDQPSFGTCMEVLFAFMNHIPVYVINQDGQLRNDVWLSYHTSSFFSSIEECFNYMKKETENGS